jgi:glycosyltransferase involved in cell wall biosynthesis
VVIRQRVDVVYTMDRSRAVIVATLVARLLRRSLVWHGHCPWHPWGLAVRAADRVAVITDFVRDEYERHGIPRHRVQVIHNGIDAEYYASSGDAEAARRRLDLGPDTPLVLMPGRLSRYKGQLELVEAMPAIAQSSPESRFVFAGGDSGELGDIRATGHPSMLAVLTARLEELGLSDRAIFTRPTDQEMADLYAAADVVVVPSWEEPFGLVVIEGMAAGAAVVGSASGGIPESIVHGESGLLVPPRDPLALGEAIRTLLGDSELRSRLGKAGQARVRALFSIERYVGDMERLLASAARPSLRSTVPYAAGSPGEA